MVPTLYCPCLLLFHIGRILVRRGFIRSYNRCGRVTTFKTFWWKLVIPMSVKKIGRSLSVFIS